MKFLEKKNTMLVVGLGLLGGSFALEFKKHFATTIIGVDNNAKNLQKALDLGLIDQKGAFSDVTRVDLILLAIPVNAIAALLLEILDKIHNKTLVFDVGSTKYEICNTVKKHPKRKQYVAMHPIAGTEFSGPQAAILNLFKNKVNIICDKEKTDHDTIKKMQYICETLQMRTIFMDSKAHDKHIAYVSHISHISSFVLGKTVLDIEKNENNIFDMAGSGFESTVRLAKSSPKMWAAIFLENQENILISLEEYIKNLENFKKYIIKKDLKNLEKTMRKANEIKKVLHK